VSTFAITGSAMMALLLFDAGVASTQQAPPAPIGDNSFLIEEAYNQEPGVVQHISLLTIQEGVWMYGFTQEWPIRSQRRQLSYTIPVLWQEAEAGVGLGDVAVNYRYQIGGMEGDRLAVAPRLTVILPTGSDRAERGARDAGIQANLPVSVAGRAFAAHFNAGATYTPRAGFADGVSTSRTDFAIGQSVVWLLRPSFNLLTEGMWTRSRTRAEPGPRTQSTSLLVSPGVRGALNFANGLQIVPGAAVAFETVGEAEPMLIFYLSFEHPFGRRE
jgi:hypothetical protein